MAQLPRLIGQELVPRQHGNPNLLPAAALAASGISSHDLKALTAAGFRITHQDTDQLRRLIQPWQNRSFNYYDQLGEIKYAAQFYSRMLSPLKLFPAYLNDDGDWEETENEIAIETLNRVQDPGGGREALLSSYGRLMFLVGEGYLLCSLDPDTGLEQWEMLSTDELRIQSGIYVRYKAPSLVAEQLHEPKDEDFEPVDDDTAIAYRIWRKHPRYSMLADSTMMGVLDLCEELLILTRAVRARARSRLAGAGILAISEEFSYAPVEATADEDVQVDPFLADLTAAMMLPIANEGTASAVVPLLIRGPSEAVEKGIRHIQLVDPTQLYPETGLRTECIDRIAIGLDMPPEILKGLSDANHWCVDEATEILTHRGWIFQDDLARGDLALTLNHETGESEWQPVLDIYRAEVEQEPMRQMMSRTHSSMTTLAHRWPVLRSRWTDRLMRKAREWTTSRDLAPEHSILTAAPYAANDEPVYTDEFVELVAWFWTEGNIGGNVTIAQSHTRNPERVERIAETLATLYGPEVKTLRGTASPAWLRTEQSNQSSFGGPITVFRLNRYAAASLLDAAPDKRVSLDFVLLLTRSQLDLFVDVSCQADGHHYRNGELDIWQKDPETLAAFELALILSGHAVSRQEHDGGAVIRALRATSVRPVKAAVEAARLDVDGATDEIVPYTGTVWCPTTTNGTWFARRNGKAFFTGNSAWAIGEETWKAHGMPVANQLVNDLTQSFFRPTLQDAGIADFERYAIRYDPADVINHPDRTKDARDAFDRRIISKEAYRRVANFDEVDEMPDDERAESIGVATRDSSLAWFGTPAPRGGNVETAPGVIESAQPGAATGEAQPATGSEVEKSPPTLGETPATSEEGLIGGANGHRKPTDAELARIIGAADLALFRAREAAGNRIKTLARRDAEMMKLIDGTAARDIAPLLGPDRVRTLKVTEVELVQAGKALIEDALRLMLRDKTAAALIADQIEKHAARTLYEAKPVPLPPQFASYVSGVLTPEK